MRLAGIELRNFRSIGEEPIILKPWNKCNILIGQNNSGKSNVIKAVRRVSAVFTKDRSGAPEDALHTLTEIDLHQRLSGNAFEFRLYIGLDDSEDSELAELLENKTCYFDFSWVFRQKPEVIDHSLAHIDGFYRANKLLSLLTNRHFSSRVGPKAIQDTFTQHSERIWSVFRKALPFTYLIPEFRKMQPGEEYTLDGAKLTNLLRSWQHPDISKDENRQKFDQVEGFLRHLLHLPHADLEVTSDGEPPTLIISNGDLRLPLSSYGTGVHELIILVTAVLSVEDAICCIEEPEIHLHPRLQREFIEFIATETNNQYLISTHSPTFINAINAREDVQVFHLKMENGLTVGGPILKDTDCLTALHDLGVKASDLLQSNCIIWVEGPTDRIFINRWLDLIDSELTEGQDYSIMFYGGKLLSHLCADREKVPDELIEILKINQNPIVVMDSDRNSADDSINETKQRVCEESQRSGGLCWITDGREIENYLSPRVIETTCEELIEEEVDISFGAYDRLGDALVRAGIRNLNYAGRKVKYARKFADNLELDDMSKQLREQIQEIADQIRAWND